MGIYRARGHTIIMINKITINIMNTKNKILTKGCDHALRISRATTFTNVKPRTTNTIMFILCPGPLRAS